MLRMIPMQLSITLPSMTSVDSSKCLMAHTHNPPRRTGWRVSRRSPSTPWVKRKDTLHAKVYGTIATTNWKTNATTNWNPITNLSCSKSSSKNCTELYNNYCIPFPNPTTQHRDCMWRRATRVLKARHMMSTKCFEAWAHNPGNTESSRQWLLLPSSPERCKLFVLGKHHILNNFL